MDDHGDANLESTLRGPRLTKRKFKTVGVVLGDGSTWQIGGPPLGGQAAIEYFTAVEKMDNAIVESDAPGVAGAMAGARVQQAAYETACVILRQTYPGLTDDQIADLIDLDMVRQIMYASSNGEARPAETDEQARDRATTRKRVAWCLANPDFNGDASKMTNVIVDGIPEDKPEPAAPNG